MKIVGAGIDLRGNNHRILYGLPVLQIGEQLLRPARMDWTVEGLSSAQMVDNLEDVPLRFVEPQEVDDCEQLGVVVVGTAFATRRLQTIACRSLIDDYDALIVKVDGSNSAPAQMAAILNHAQVAQFRDGLRTLLANEFAESLDAGFLSAKAAFDNMASSGTISHDQFLIFAAVLSARFGPRERYDELRSRIERSGRTAALEKALLSAGLERHLVSSRLSNIRTTSRVLGIQRFPRHGDSIDVYVKSVKALKGLHSLNPVVRGSHFESGGLKYGAGAIPFEIIESDLETDSALNFDQVPPGIDNSTADYAA